MQSNGVDHHEETRFDNKAELSAVPARPVPVDYSHMIAVLAAWKDILNARLLAVLSLLGTLGGFAWCMGEPSSLRLCGLAIYAILCQAPILWLYSRKG